MLRKRQFGRACPEITELTFGAMRFSLGTVISNELLYALERGVGSIDTARIYGDSEEIIGRTLAEWKGEPPFISTKIAPSPGDWRYCCELEQAFTPASMRDSVETSLKKLKRETLDLVVLHQWYALWTHRPEWLETFQALKTEGKIQAYGISAQDHEHDALLQVVDLGLVDTVQLIVNLFESRPFNSIVPLCRKRNVGVMVRCVLDEGALSGALSREQFDQRGWLNPEFYEAYQRRLRILRDNYCDDDNSLVDLAIRFAISHPGVSTLTMSMQEKTHVDANIAAMEKGPLEASAFDAIRKKYVWTKNFFEPKF